MSSRALRKLQKQRELERLAAAQEPDEGHESSDEEPQAFAPSRKVNAFDLLNTPDDEEDEPELDNDAAPSETPQAAPVAQNETKSKKKKSKKKKKKAAKGAEHDVTPAETEEMDEIDRALKELAIQNRATTAQGGGTSQAAAEQSSRFPKTQEELLQINPKSLNPIYEMRRLFGDIVFESFDQPERTSSRRRERQREMLDLGRALSGRYSPASRGKSLAGATQRKNVLVTGKDEWPRAPSGGLGMELVEKLPDGNHLYRLVHNQAYRDVQMQFEMSVEIMDSQSLIALLQHNRESRPSFAVKQLHALINTTAYHISTLLQVSEIAKHQGDHAVSADLLERALFNIGRAAHSTFAKQLQAGKAKFDFTVAANREFWLAGWRYIANLGLKGTWRTAYEWAKLLLSLDFRDPYCIRLLIDNLAMRGRQYEHFIELCTQTAFAEEWNQLPNIQSTLALAYYRSNQQKKAREQLRAAMSRFPWVFSRLAQELDIQPVPKRIWGKMPPAQSHELLTELYINRTKDLWNSPELVSLIVEVADTLTDAEEPAEPPEITLDIARHVILSDMRNVLSLVPTRFLSGRIIDYDPLPPQNSEVSQAQANSSQQQRGLLSRLAQLVRPQLMDELLERIHVGAQEQGPAEAPDMSDSDEELDPAVPPSGRNQERVRQWLLGPGLGPLQESIRRQGVGPEHPDLNIDDAVDNYLDALAALNDGAREEFLLGTLTGILGEHVVNALEVYLHEYFGLY